MWAGKSRQAVLAKQRKSSADNGVVRSQQECQAVAGADQVWLLLHQATIQCTCPLRPKQIAWALLDSV